MLSNVSGAGNVACSKIGNLHAGVVLSTTPNIGTKGYPIPRSKNIQKLVHVFHAFDDLSTLHKGAIDHYDVELLVGDFEIPLIRKLESLRNLPAKELIPGGIPYMDELLKKAAIKDVTNSTIGKEKNLCFNNPEDITVLLVPSWGGKGFPESYGARFHRKTG